MYTYAKPKEKDEERHTLYRRKAKVSERFRLRFIVGKSMINGYGHMKCAVIKGY